MPNSSARRKSVAELDILLRMRLDLGAQERDDLLSPLAHPADVDEGDLLIREVGEEQAEHALVSVLEQVAVASKPVVEGVLAGQACSPYVSGGGRLLPPRAPARPVRDGAARVDLAEARPQKNLVEISTDCLMS